VLEELTSLAEAERRCCGFVQWHVEVREGSPLLEVVADPASPDDLTPIAAMFGV
jgi:hypothetical protein